MCGHVRCSCGSGRTTGRADIPRERDLLILRQAEVDLIREMSSAAQAEFDKQRRPK